MPLRAVKGNHRLDCIYLIRVEEGSCIYGLNNDRHVEEVRIVAKSIIKGVVFAVDNVAWLIYQFFNTWPEGTVCLINCAVIGSWRNIEWTKIEIGIGVGSTIEMTGVAVKAVFRKSYAHVVFATAFCNRVGEFDRSKIIKFFLATE